MKEWLREHAPGASYLYKVLQERISPTRLGPPDGPIVDLLCRGEPYVLHGPFEGMRYVSAAAGSAFVSKIVGSYEEELQDWVRELLGRGYSRVIDIGAAEGYYAVGFALRAPQAGVYAFDRDPIARYWLRRLARLNGVRDRVHSGGLCSHAELLRLGGKGALLICDCEGAEADLLDPVAAPSLAETDMLVEFHDFIRSGAAAAVQARFLATHDIRLTGVRPRQPDRYPELQRLSGPQREYAIYERPDQGQQWGLFLAKG